VKEKTFVDKFKAELSRLVAGRTMSVLKCNDLKADWFFCSYVDYQVLSSEDTLDVVRGGLPFLNTIGANKGLLEPRTEKWQKPPRVLSEGFDPNDEMPYPQDGEYPFDRYSDRLYDFAFYSTDLDY